MTEPLFNVYPVGNSEGSQPVSASFGVEPLLQTPLPPVTKPQTWTKKLLLWLLAGAALVVAASMLYFFVNRSPFREDQVSMAINAPEQIKSGDLVNYAVKVSNQSAVALQTIRLIFFYPAGATPVNATAGKINLTEEVKISDIGAHSEQVINFSAYLVGNSGEVKQARAQLVFSPINIHSSFIKQAEHSISFGELAVGLSLTAPPSVIPGQTVNYTLAYQNVSGTDEKDLRLVLTYPSGFQFTRADPAATQGNNIWEIPLLAAGENKQLVIIGQLSGKEQENKTVSAVLQRREATGYIDYEKIEGTSVITTAPLSATILLNELASYNPKPGEHLVYQIRFTNNSSVALQGLTVTAQLTGNMYDWSALNSDGAFDAGSHTIVWNASVAPILASLAPGQTGAVNFLVRLKDNLPGSNLNTRDFVIRTAAQVNTPTTPPGIDSNGLTAKTELTSRVSALPNISQSASLGDATFGASGPLPPKVGQATSYTIHWRVQSIATSLNSTEIKVKLPVSVNWNGKVRSASGWPAPIYKTSTREVVWDLGQVLAGTGGGSLSAAEAWFQISATPTVNQVGRPVDLMNAVSLSAKDSSSGESIVIQADKVDSNQLVDRPNQGEVVE